MKCLNILAPRKHLISLCVFQAPRGDRGLCAVHGAVGGGARDEARRHQEDRGRREAAVAQGEGRGLWQLSDWALPPHQVRHTKIS